MSARQDHTPPDGRSRVGPSPEGRLDGSAADGSAGAPDGAATLDALLRGAVECARAALAAGDDGRRPGPAEDRRDGTAREGATQEAPVRAALAVACTRARADGLSAEQSLLRLKHAWAHTPETLAGERTAGSLRGLRSRDGHDDLSRVVTLFIEEFYRRDDAAASDGASTDAPSTRRTLSPPPAP